MLGRDADRDPFDMPRRLMQAALDKIAMYAGMCAACLEDRDDDGADVMARRVVAHVKAMKIYREALAAAYTAAPQRAAAAHFAAENPHIRPETGDDGPVDR